MRILAFASLALAVSSGTALGQAVSEWRLGSGLPVAVVETPGGDLQRLVVLVPPGQIPPERVLGFPATVLPRRDGVYWVVGFPAVLAGEGLLEVSRMLVDRGASSMVTVGPTPARMLALGLENLEQVPWRAPRRRPCVVADGSVEVRRGSPEGVEVSVAAFPPDDPRFPFLPALNAWLRLRLGARMAGVEVATVVEDGCSRIAVRAPSPRDHPRETLAALRLSLRALASRPPTAEEAAAVDAMTRRDAARWTMDGAGFAVLLAQRLAFGGQAGGLLHPPLVDENVLAGLAAALLTGRQGSAVMVEQERRPRWEPPERLENGVMVSVRWIPGDVATLGVAFGSVDPRPVMALGRQAALTLSRGGWPAEVVDMAGVPTLAVAMPPEDAVAVIETVAELLVNGESAPGEGEWADAMMALGLSAAPSPAALSVALLLPPAADEAPEAVAKFLSGLRQSRVEVAGLLTSPGLNWAQESGPPRILAAVELPPGTPGYLAGEVLAARLGGEPGVEARWLQPPGRLVLAVTISGEVDVPALDRRAAGLWRQIRRSVGDEDLVSARQRLTALFLGDLGRATARSAVEALVLDLPRPEELVAMSAREVSQVLQDLPRWEDLTRFAAGPGPQEPVAPAPPRRAAPRRPPG